MGADPALPAVEALTIAVAAFLKRHPPFDEMEEAALRFMASRLAVGYYPKGARILAPEHGEPQSFYIIRNGLVQLAPVETYHLPSGIETTLGPGECFSVGALLERRPVASAYVAAADTFCYQLPASGFHELLHRSPRFMDFSTRYLASLLHESRRLLKMHHASLATEQQALGRTLRSLVGRPAVCCAPDVAIGSALQSMHADRIGSIVIVTGDRVPAGIFTRHDVLDRVTLPGRSLNEPISAVMTPAPRTLPAEASAYDAALLIARNGIRHVPVVDGGKLIGVITERDLFALQRVSIRSVHRVIAGASHKEELKQAASDIRSLARSLIAEGAAAEPLTLIISTLNDELTRRIIELEGARHAVDGVAWAWLGFGSEGRYEQTISTDQDNGIIFVSPPGSSADDMRGRLVPFAQAVNAMLDACGYPLCTGNVMAGNPQWCLSLDEWLQRFEDWISNSNPQALLNATIFFDFRLLHGREPLVEALSERLHAWTTRTPRFLRQMAQQAISVRPPLGVLSDFVTEEAPGGGRTLDLKKSGARLFVDAARVIALSTGIAHSSTAERLRQGGSKLGVDAHAVTSFVEAFFFIQLLRLRRQAADGNRGYAAGNLIDPDTLNEVDRRTLKESLRQARRLQARLAVDYQL